MPDEKTPSMWIQVLVLGLMLLVLSLMVAPITSLVEERQERQYEAEREIGDTWGGSQRISGPVLTIPRSTPHLRARELERLQRAGSAERTRDLTVLPEALDIAVEVTPQERRRGLFTTLVYTARITLSGHFRAADLDLGQSADRPWERAELLFGPSDLGGLLASPRVEWGGEALDIEPSGGSHDLPLGTLRAHGPALARSLAPPPVPAEEVAEEPGASPASTVPPTPLRREGRLAFRAEFLVRGSGDLDFLPLGRNTEVKMVSAWPHPSFRGAFLPSTPAEVEEGMQGEWSIPHFARGYGQRLEPRAEEVLTLKKAILDSAFGVRLMKPIDFYQLVTRCTKYALLFAVLILGAFLVYELLCHLKLHPIQYLMVGSALTLFYLLLLALAEHVGFRPAFLAAATATTLLVSAYGASLLRSRRRAAGLALTLATMYGVLFVLVQLQSYALLVGSLVLFALLAAAMWLTRHVDWHEAVPVRRSRQPTPVEVEV